MRYEETVAQIRNWLRPRATQRAARTCHSAMTRAIVPRHAMVPRRASVPRHDTEYRHAQSEILNNRMYPATTVLYPRRG